MPHHSQIHLGNKPTLVICNSFCQHSNHYPSNQVCYDGDGQGRILVSSQRTGARLRILTHTRRRYSGLILT